MILSALLLAATAPAPRPRSPARPAATARAVAPSSEWLKGLWVAETDKGDQMEGCASWQREPGSDDEIKQ